MNNYMRHYQYLLLGLFVSICLLPARAMAGDCFVDPVHQYTGTGNVGSAVFLRDQACMDGSSVLTTLSAGTAVSVLGYTDGWYSVSANGARGWVGQQFVSNGAAKTGKVWSSYQAYISEYPSSGPAASVPTSKPPVYDSNFISRVKGYILLQVQEHGEAWYVDPVSQERSYMRDGAVAYQMMRSYGLGITDADLNKLPKMNTTAEIINASSICASNSLANRLKGRILLQIQQHGEAYYVYPKNCRMIYMKDGAAAYEIMRYLGLGITNADLDRVEVK